MSLISQDTNVRCTKESPTDRMHSQALTDACATQRPT